MGTFYGYGCDILPAKIRYKLQLAYFVVFMRNYFICIINKIYIKFSGLYHISKLSKNTYKIILYDQNKLCYNQRNDLSVKDMKELKSLVYVWWCELGSVVGPYTSSVYKSSISCNYHTYADDTQLPTFEGKLYIGKH